MFCCQVTKYHIEMYEGTAVVALEFDPTVRLLCPGCHIRLEVEAQEGLTVSSYSLNFTHETLQTLQLRAVRTSSTYSRIVRFKYRAVISEDGSVWRRYSMPDVRVTEQLPLAPLFMYIV